MSSVKSIVISCAGIGSRLGLGQTKALVKVNGKSLIAWQLEMFKDVEDIRIVIGYQANDIIEEVLKYRKDVVFVYNHKYFETKTGASFFLGSQHASEYVLEWDGDLIVHPDDVKKILNTEGEFVCYSEISSEETIFVQTDKNGDVQAFSREKGDHEWTGPVCMLRKKVMYSPDNVYNQIEPHLPMKGMLIRAYDIDTYNDYQRVLEITKNW